ncbi:YdcF family protein [Pseudonocardia sp. MH-G8]|uniref:YdcF family protein n=1 Tax=Pseudonocardia sp. MH-G8 TaxID=1854588 RepID=UPI000B9FB6A6|nr:YdcF family protein [Pseudonocardia sp. MH-G8]OZM76820.1 hypothetical protein CFP66_39545 [Pseudonocardia sp. MH-G8]
MSESLPFALVALLVAAPLLLTAVVCWVTARRIRREPRRLSNAYWLLAAALLLGNALGVLGIVGTNPVVATVGLLLVLSPLLALVFAAFLIANGVVMLRRERVSAGNSLSLLLGLLIVALFAFSASVLLAGSLWLRAVWLVCVLAVLFLSFQFVAFLGYARLYTWLVRDQPVEWVVVLGSGLRGSEVPPLLASRIRKGMAEFARRGARTLVMSGGRGDDEQLPEGEAMRRWAVDHGADADVVRAETASRNTEQNLRFSDALVRGERGPGGAGTGTGLIVTSDYHVFRASLLARRLGVDAQAVGAPTAGYYWPSAVLREFVALLREYRVINAVLLLVVALPLPLVVVLAAS